jgi:lycopene cyclase domain-containing protein
MPTYLLLVILIVLFPLLLSMRWKFRYADNYRYLFPAIAIVGGAYIVWDVVVTALGHWAFNDHHVTGVRVHGLPVEELLFFVVVPYSCIFIYENLEFFLPERATHAYRRGILLVPAALFFIGAAVFRQQQYTMAALASCGIFLLLAFHFHPGLLASRNYWAYIGLCMIPFVIFNFILTSLPVVVYNPQAIWGGDGWWNGRFLTIPLEDFFYNYSMLSLYLLVYLVLKRRSARGRAQASARSQA